MSAAEVTDDSANTTSDAADKMDRPRIMSGWLDLQLMVCGQTSSTTEPKHIILRKEHTSCRFQDPVWQHRADARFRLWQCHTDVNQAQRRSQTTNAGWGAAVCHRLMYQLLLCASF